MVRRIAALLPAALLVAACSGGASPSPSASPVAHVVELSAAGIAIDGEQLAVGTETASAAIWLAQRLGAPTYASELSAGWVPALAGYSAEATLCATTSSFLAWDQFLVTFYDGAFQYWSLNRSDKGSGWVAAATGETYEPKVAGASLIGATQADVAAALGAGYAALDMTDMQPWPAGFVVGATAAEILGSPRGWDWSRDPGSPALSGFYNANGTLDRMSGGNCLL
jgi:hypothetical protein